MTSSQRVFFLALETDSVYRIFIFDIQILPFPEFMLIQDQEGVQRVECIVGLRVSLVLVLLLQGELLAPVT